MKPNITYAIIACHVDRGMKSHGSKALMVFNKKKLIEYQIEWIKKANKNNNYEIIIIADFEVNKLSKHFNYDYPVIESKQYNPVFTACEASGEGFLCCIDYGCLFSSEDMTKLHKNDSSVLVLKKDSKLSTLDVGCIIDKVTGIVKHMFLDLPNHKFCNIFSISSKDKQKILENKHTFSRHNLLYFEILNSLIEFGSDVRHQSIPNNNFLYFNNIKQHNAIQKFIKTIN